MHELSSEERGKLLAYLEAHAGDETLINAVADTVESIVRAKSEYKRISAQLGASPKATKPAEEPATVTEKNVQPPPGIAAGRIGAVSKNAIESLLRHGPATPRDVNAGINGKTDNTYALLKLLWQRGSIKWDGERYSI